MTAPPCRNDCAAPLLFPATISNRPGLPHIAFRIGAYTDIRDYLLRQLDVEPTLLPWTHRRPDDPGIALLEGAAILGDILTFYQELYANEAYLRTARWRESIADLVKLLGYRLTPGVGGHGTFAFLVHGTTPVIVPSGFPISAQLTGDTTPDDFQTSSDLTAYPQWSQFNLYRPRNTPQPIAAGANQLEIQAVGGATDVDSIGAFDLQAGDRILLAPNSALFDDASPDVGHIVVEQTEILVVKQVETVLDRRIITFEGALTSTRGANATAYKLGRSFRHFGAIAPALTTKLDGGGSGVSQDPTNYARSIAFATTPAAADVNYYSTIAALDIPLEREVSDLAAGGPLVCEADVVIEGMALHATVARRIGAVRSSTAMWGNLTGATTVVTLGDPIVDNYLGGTLPLVDIRGMRFHETDGAALTVRALSTWPSGPFPNTTVAAFGTLADMTALAERPLLLQGADGTVQSLSVLSQPADFSPAGRDDVHAWMWPVQLDQRPDPFTRDDFDEVSPTVTVFGNVVGATQGKQQRPAILGNGDARLTYQTFKIPKSPLTYLAAPGATPPEAPELQIEVSDRVWTQVDSLFGAAATDQVYIVREDANGDSWVQFGDGVAGARLPSGLNNVVATWRVGVNAFGLLKESTTPQGGGKVDRLDKIKLPGLVAGGAAPETGVHARATAPGRVQSLGRLVSLRDYETETMTIPGVALTAASWAVVDNIPAVVLTVLMDSGREAEIDSVRQSVSAANRCRGPRRFPVIALEGHRRWVFLAANVTLDPSYDADTVLAAVTDALMHEVVDDEDTTPAGLFALSSRTFGEPEYATRIEGAIQQVSGVVWTAVTGFGLLDAGDDPSLLTAPPTPWLRTEVASASPQEVLALDAAHLVLLPAAAVTLTCS
ncbi:MAG: hypothetical protein ACREND_02075 [Gemmatimonadaceae bacterium]